MTALIGKYFLGFQDGFPVAGIVVESVNDGHYLVRVDGFEDEPWHFAVAAVAHMVGRGDGNDNEPPSWLFFDTTEQRANYQAWLMVEAPPDRRPRVVVPLRKREETDGNT